MILFLQSINSFRYIPENESEHPVLGWNTSLTALPNGALNTIERTSPNHKEISLFRARSTSARTEMESKAECICLHHTTTRSGKEGKHLGIPLRKKSRRLGLPQNAKQPMPSLPPKKMVGSSNCQQYSSQPSQPKSCFQT